MDPASKKRKPEENGAAAPTAELTPADARKILEPFTHDQLLDIVATAISAGGDSTTVLDAVRSIADRESTQRKLFVRGLGWDTTHDSLRAAFSPFGELEEAVVIADKATGRSKGYGFVTFRHIDGALLALKEPSKKIDSRVTVTQLAAAGGPGAAAPVADIALRKIYVGNVSPDMSSDSLLSHFSSYGEIEEGPLGYDKMTGRFKGYALFVYKTAEAAQASLVNPTKTIDGYNVLCKLANADGKRGKPGAPVQAGANAGVPQGQPGFSGVNNIAGDGHGLGAPYGAPGGGISSYSGYTGSALQGAGALGHHQSLNSSLQTSLGLGNPGLSSAGSQVPSSLGGAGAGGYGGGLGGHYGSSAQYPAPGSGGYSGVGVASALYGGRVPPSSAGMPSGGFPESGQYPLSSSISSSYQSQHHQPASSPGRRYPTGGYPSMNPYY